MRDQDDHSNRETDTTDHEHKKSLRRSWRTSGPVAKLTAVFSGIAAAATLVYAIAAIAQLIVMSRQLTEIKNGESDTHTLALAADTQAKKMSTVSDAAEKIRQAAEGMVQQDQRIADNAQKALEASNKQSRAALDESIATSREDQRAWVGVVEFGIPRNLATGQKPAFVAVATNTGKSPALNVVVIITATPFRKGETFYPKTTPLAGKPAVMVLQPGMRISIATSLGDTPYTERNISDLKSGETIMFVYGEITYDDVFGRKHRTHYCGRMDVDLSSFYGCQAYNNAN